MERKDVLDVKVGELIDSLLPLQFIVVIKYVD